MCLASETVEGSMVTVNVQWFDTRIIAVCHMLAMEFSLIYSLIPNAMLCMCMMMSMRWRETRHKTCSRTIHRIHGRFIINVSVATYELLAKFFGTKLSINGKIKKQNCELR